MNSFPFEVVVTHGSGQFWTQGKLHACFGWRVWIAWVKEKWRTGWEDNARVSGIARKAVALRLYGKKAIVERLEPSKTNRNGNLCYKTHDKGMVSRCQWHVTNRAIDINLISPFCVMLDCKCMRENRSSRRNVYVCTMHVLHATCLGPISRINRPANVSSESRGKLCENNFLAVRFLLGSRAFHRRTLMFNTLYTAWSRLRRSEILAMLSGTKSRILTNEASRVYIDVNIWFLKYTVSKIWKF